jgi:fatty-acid desaturase
MVDPSAWMIRRFEQLGWATRVRWPVLVGDLIV